MKDPGQLRSLLSQHFGTESYTYNPLYPWLKYTDGVCDFAKHAGNGAYWFLDIIGTELHKLANREEFLSIALDVKGSAAVITADDGNGKVLWSKQISFTDCPEGEWKFFLSHHVLMLAQEY